MYKHVLTVMLLSFLVLLTGCSELNQLENLGYGVVLGIDENEQNRIVLTVQIPKITGSSGDSSGGSSDAGPLVFSAEGANFEEALNMLQWAVPRKLSLTQLQLIVASEKLASSDAFPTVLNAIMSTNKVYTAARFAVCEGDALDFIQAENQSIGAHIFTELEAMFEDYTENGFIPDVTFADLYYKTCSIYSDPLSIYAASDPEGMLKQPSDPESKPASALITPSDPKTDYVKTQQINRFLGAAVFHGGRMVGKLTGDQVIYCKLLRGNQQTFPYTKAGHMFYLTRIGYPRVKIDTSVDPIRISVNLRLSVLPGSDHADLTGMEQDLELQLMNTINACKAMKAEPFQFAETAARHFPTLRRWQAFHWSERFIASDPDINVRLRLENR